MLKKHPAPLPKTLLIPVRRIWIATLLLLLSHQCLHAQNRPKLVVGIVVDQMRPDYLTRFRDRYGEGGFKRLLREGLVCENTFIPYTPTYTAPGHASVYTGSVPSLHGIVGNNWYDRNLKRTVYCTSDDSVYTIGSSSNGGKQSPRNLWANTITDELRLATNFRSKTVGIAIKDRGSILPAGHTASAAYWFDNASGGWVTSSFYTQRLPDWVTRFNARRLPDSALLRGWNTLFPLTTYVQSDVDDALYEDRLPGEDASFPHTTAGITTDKYESFKYLPAGNTYTFEFAKSAIQNDSLGRDGVTDFLAVSFSSTDYIGHKFGPNSVEIEDCYLRFDRDLASFLTHLDATVGKGQYLLFLTGDHSVAHIPAYGRSKRLPTYAFDDAVLRTELNRLIKAEFGYENAVDFAINYQLYLGVSVPTDMLRRKPVLDFVVRHIQQYESISHAFALPYEAHYLPQKVGTMVINGFNAKRSGDVQYIFKPGWFDGGPRGTTHGAWNPYDSHIPLLWFGNGVRSGRVQRRVEMTDIAPTLAAYLGIQMPNASVGEVMEEVLR